MENTNIQTNQGNSIITIETLQPIRDLVARGANDTELTYFAQYCNQVKLNPVAKQIHFVVRTNYKGERQLAFQTSIDGYRIIAERSGAYAGNDDYRFDEGLSEYEHIQTKRGNPTTATATIYKVVGGLRVPYSATARWSEYYPGEKLGFMWTKMPYLMLGKCAEALALRKAFPNDLSGLYTDEEMQQADKPVKDLAAEQAFADKSRDDNRVSKDDEKYAAWEKAKKEWDEVLEENKINKGKAIEKIVKDNGAPDIYHITPKQFHAAIEKIQKWAEAKLAEAQIIVEDAKEDNSKQVEDALILQEPKKVQKTQSALLEDFKKEIDAAENHGQVTIRASLQKYKSLKDLDEYHEIIDAKEEELRARKPQHP